MEAQTTVQIPRVAIRFCTQCKWNLRAAYYAQELLQTFSTSIGEISLIPVTGGIFTITLYHLSSNSNSTSSDQTEITTTLIWDRKRDTGFPETKELKNRIRNIIDPDRDMGHIDRSLKKTKTQTQNGGEEQQQQQSKNESSSFPSSSSVEAQTGAQGGESLSFGSNLKEQRLVQQQQQESNQVLSTKTTDTDNDRKKEVAAGGEGLSFGENNERLNGVVPENGNGEKEVCEDCK